ncbi:DUF6976 family protein [Azospirillum soli]|uniref:DUF6976 family protein n=1 Tax=Azospirillum soli TaxID=1304799 RepID=UPI001AE39A26|nr:hypothetical protein [Azospirillum soli]MBP2311387.1 hypothetical protein [Azospirillum soli]
MTPGLIERDEAATLIESGRTLLLAGDEALLTGLPRGRWIAGTIPYFMTETGGVASRDRVFAAALPEPATSPLIRFYGTEALSGIGANTPENGFTALIIPAFSEPHTAFAQGVFSFEGVFNAPLVGWIAGVAAEDVGKRPPKVFNGATGESSATMALAMHMPLPAGLSAKVGIVNPFRQGDGPAISFAERSFTASECMVDGEPVNLVRYIREQGIDRKLPLVADYFGTPVNVSIESIDEAAGQVRFYAPVFPGIAYRFAAPLDDYDAAFRTAAAEASGEPVFACNCIRNYQYTGFPGAPVAPFSGPLTFGEIAYVLVNQTLVYLTIDGITPPPK